MKPRFHGCDSPDSGLTIYTQMHDSHITQARIAWGNTDEYTINPCLFHAIRA